MVMKTSENQDKKTHHQFCKIVHPDQLTTQHLRIPSKFEKHISRKSYDQGVILEGPSGRHWHAKLCRTRDGTYIQEGWQEFVTDHSLWDDEILVFKYDGNMCFSIQIFDDEGCERENVYTSSETHEEPIVEKRKPDRTHEEPIVEKRKPDRTHEEPIVEKRKPDRPPKKKFISCSSQKQGTLENKSTSYSSNERRGPAKKRRLVSHSTHFGEEPSPTTSCKGNLGQQIQTMDEDEDDSLPIYGSNNKTTLYSYARTNRILTEEEAKLSKAVESFSSKHPHFISHLRKPTLWNTYLYFPASFSRVYFPRHDINIILRNKKGNAWTVKVVFYISYRHGMYKGKMYTRRMHYMSEGWPAFVSYNKLEVGDMCIFELVGKREFCVRSFRLVNEDHVGKSVL